MIVPKKKELQDDAIEGVHSIKVLREAKMNQSMNHALPPPPLNMMADSASQQGNQGEKEQEDLLDEDSLLEKIDQHKKFDKEELRTMYKQIVEALKSIRLGKTTKEQHVKYTNDNDYGADYKALEDIKERRSKRDL
jgi:hypothetical protein